MNSLSRFSYELHKDIKKKIVTLFTFFDVLYAQLVEEALFQDGVVAHDVDRCSFDPV